MKTILPFAGALLLAACLNTQGPQKSEAVVAAPMTHSADPVATAQSYGIDAATPTEYPGLHNVFWLGKHIVSGSEPHGDVALDKLAELGVKTILSVDGKAPDAAGATARGMRYVHIPIEYSGMTDEEEAEIAKTFRELPGPFYVHCFHGKHRGPTAAAISASCSTASRAKKPSRDAAMVRHRRQYRGLFEAIAWDDIPTAHQTRAMKFDFPATRTFEGVRAAHDPRSSPLGRSQMRRKTRLGPRPNTPTSCPPKRPSRLSQLFTQLLNMKDTPRRNAPHPEVQSWFQDGLTGTTDLARLLTNQNPTDPTWQSATKTAYDLAASSCTTACKQFRGDPLQFNAKSSQRLAL
ncbi:MAG: hypothetical protein R3E96_10385 [Planctomycetota bacterium]